MYDYHGCMYVDLSYAQITATTGSTVTFKRQDVNRIVSNKIIGPIYLKLNVDGYIATGIVTNIIHKTNTSENYINIVTTSNSGEFVNIRVYAAGLTGRVYVVKEITE